MSESSCNCCIKSSTPQDKSEEKHNEGKGEEKHEVDQGSKLTKPENFAGPIKSRHCTDILCLLLIIAMWVAMTAVGADGIINGNPYILVNGIDEKGRICGVDSGVEDKPNWYALNIYAQGVCVTECPSETQTLEISTSLVDDMICISSLETTADRLEYVTETCDMTNPDNWGKCECNFAIKSKAVVGYCWITEEVVYDFATMFAESADAQSGGYITELFGDIFLTKHVIYGFGFGVSLCLSFLYAAFLRVPYVAVIMVWGSIAFVGAAMGIMSYQGWMLAEDWAAEDPEIHEPYEVRSLKSFASGFIIVTVLYWCTMIALRNRINLAIGVVKEAAEALTDMPMIVFSPVLQLFAFIVFMCPWIIYCFYTASLGEVSVENYAFDDDTMPTIQYKSFTYSKDAKERGWFLFFCLLWTANFILAFGQLHVALCFSTWYFTRDKKDVGNKTVFSSIGTIIRYHLGTIAFGSFIIALIEFIRAIVLYIERQAKKGKNRMLELIMKILQCFLWCVEKCLKFINKNAYIQTAIFGYSFCKATKEAFFLILRNILRVGAVCVVSQFIIIIGRMFVTVGTGFLAYFYIIVRYETKVNNIASPTVCAMVLAYITATMFCEIFTMGIDTILQCFVADEEMFEDPNDRFAEEDLKAWLNAYGGKIKKAVVDENAVTVQGEVARPASATEQSATEHSVTDHSTTELALKTEEDRL